MKLIFLIICSFFILISLGKLNKFSDWLFEKTERFISPLLLYPCIFYGISHLGYESGLFSQGNDPLGFTHGIIVAMMSISLFTLYYLCEKASEIIRNESKFRIFVLSVFLVLFSLSLNYAVQYELLYYYDPECFLNVPEDFIFIDFFIYSFGIVTNSTLSSIIPSSIYAKILLCSEVLCSFAYLVIILANYREIGKLLNKS